MLEKKPESLSSHILKCFNTFLILYVKLHNNKRPNVSCFLIILRNKVFLNSLLNFQHTDSQHVLFNLATGFYVT